MKISLYELFTLINENKAPSKIKYNNNIYEFDGENYLTKEKNCRVCLGGKINEINMLCIMFDENKIEIIEEPKKIHPLEYYDNSISWCINGREITDNEKDIIDKLNELIDKVNEMEDK